MVRSGRSQAVAKPWTHEALSKEWRGIQGRLDTTPTPVPPAGEGSALEKYIAISLVGNLLDGDKSSGTANVFLALYEAPDEHNASYAQGTLQLVFDAATAEKVAGIAQSLGINAQMRDQWRVAPWGIARRLED